MQQCLCPSSFYFQFHCNQDLPISSFFQKFIGVLGLWFIIATASIAGQALVLQTDFGIKDGAVAEMKGVAFGVNPGLEIFDLTHEITPYQIWEGAYRLAQTAQYWPPGTVFVSVVDPGVGTQRKSIVLKSKTGHYFVTPDNGTLTLIAERLGVAEIREIDEKKHRLPGSNSSYTFHGRDVYAYTGAKLAAGKVTFSEIGPKLANNQLVRLPTSQAKLEHNRIEGHIDIMDVRYGNLWTNISQSLFQQFNVSFGDKLLVEIFHKDKKVYSKTVPYVKSFGEVSQGQPLVYLNSLLNLSMALNQASFAEINHIGIGPDWGVRVQKIAA